MTGRRSIRLAAAVAASVVAVVVLSAGPATAHIAILLEITQPQPGAQVGPDSDVVILAQRTLAGIDQVSYVGDLDGRPLDPATGRPTDTQTPWVIRAGQQQHITLHRLTAGLHRLSISYRPDTDEPVFHRSIDFTVIASTVHHRSWLPIEIGVAVVVAGAAMAVGLRRRAAAHRSVVADPALTLDEPG